MSPQIVGENWCRMETKRVDEDDYIYMYMRDIMNIFALPVMTTYSHLSSFFFILYGYFVLFCFVLVCFIWVWFGLVWFGFGFGLAGFGLILIRCGLYWFILFILFWFGLLYFILLCFCGDR